MTAALRSVPLRDAGRSRSSRRRASGAGFRWLLASSWASNLGDGIALAAGPLLVASQTDQEFLVALAALLQWLPPLLFGLCAGALADRLDRRLIVVTVDLLRAARAGRCSPRRSLTDVASIALVLVAMFLLGTAEVFADNTSSTLLPMLVHRDDLAIGNARLQTGFITINQLVGAADRRRALRGRAWRRRSRPRPCWSCCSVRPAHPASRCRRTAATADAAPTRSGTTSPRASAGAGTTPRCARWC